MMRVCVWVSCLLLTTIASSIVAAPVDFVHEVVPILKARCVQCHGNGKTEGELAIDTRELLLASKTVVPKDAASSDLIERVRATDKDVRMPPEGARLTEQQVAVLTKWIDEGVEWEPTFTFQSEHRRASLTPRTPTLPPVVEGRTNPIDRIVGAYWASVADETTSANISGGASRLTQSDTGEPTQAESQRTRPSPWSRSLDDAKFARRVSLDLIGLLPTVEDLDRFLADDRADKRARLVEELLNRDQQYAEHWLTFWNDLLRNDYAGTGFIDKGRKQITGWLYQSLKANKPYDEFVRELISPTDESEGFIYGIKWRGRVNASQGREIQFAQNVGQVFLGVNLKCASCHDSFIDDWTLKETYDLAAVIAEQPLEIHRCDKPTETMAEATSPFPELGVIDPLASKEERLKSLAEILTSEQNGRLARTIVNRLWERLIGRGIVHPVDVMDNEPWSRDLLDHLASNLVAHDYDLRQTLSLIGTSELYSLQSVTLDELPATNDFVFTGPIAKQMTAEQFLDAVWRITQTSPEKPHKSVEPVIQDREDEPIRASLLTADLLARSLGRPGREQVVTTRPVGLTTLQALDLSNGDILAGLLSRGSKSLAKSFGDKGQREPLIDHLFRNTLSRPPNDTERQIAAQILSDPPQETEIADLLWSLLLLPEFQLVP